MSVAYFLAKRIFSHRDDGNHRVSSPAIRIATAAIAVGLTVMILTVAIVVGFKREIRDRISDFGGHLQVLALSANKTYEKVPICMNDSLWSVIEKIPHVAQIEPFITKPSVIKTPDDFLSVVIKSQEGLGERDVCISETIARKLRLKVGDRIQLFFVQNDNINGEIAYGGTDASVKVRSLTIASLYQTHFNQYDENVILGNREMLQRVGGWDDDMASGWEIHLSDFDCLDVAYDEVTLAVAQTQDRRGTQLCVQTLEQQNPQIFGWLDLLDTNVWVILSLMVVVAAFTMISGVLIIILERTQMIGVLKALGCNNAQLRHTFLYVSMLLIIKGLAWGDVVGLGLCTLQAVWHPVSLDPENYYLEWVPVCIRWWQVVALNVGALVITMSMLLIPSALVGKIAPSKAMKIDN